MGEMQTTSSGRPASYRGLDRLFGGSGAMWQGIVTALVGNESDD